MKGLTTTLKDSLSECSEVRSNPRYRSQARTSKKQDAGPQKECNYHAPLASCHLSEGKTGFQAHLCGCECLRESFVWGCLGFRQYAEHMPLLRVHVPERSPGDWRNMPLNQ
eukprot:3010463-Amphidinium_carterae.1